jgi:hypothetical protein
MLLKILSKIIFYRPERIRQKWNFLSFCRLIARSICLNNIHTVRLSGVDILLQMIEILKPNATDLATTSLSSFNDLKIPLLLLAETLKLKYINSNNSTSVVDNLVTRYRSPSEEEQLISHIRPFEFAKETSSSTPEIINDNYMDILNKILDRTKFCLIFDLNSFSLFFNVIFTKFCCILVSDECKDTEFI